MSRFRSRSKALEVMKVSARSPRQKTSVHKYLSKPGPQRLRTRTASDKWRNASPACNALEQASACLRRSQNLPDRFQLNLLVAQILFVQLHEHAELEYSHSRTKYRSLQTGQGRLSFSNLFEPLTAIALVRLFENLLRFSSYEAYAPARAYFLTYAALSFEHDASGEYIGPGVWRPESGSRTAVVRVRRTLKRWCDWLEALTHFQVHQSHQPASQTLVLDKAIIFLWPLLQKHKWSYDDLLKILETSTNCRGCFPCQTVEQLAAYCRNSLGLRSERTIAATDSATSLAGYAVAERLLRFLPMIC